MTNLIQYIKNEIVVSSGDAINYCIDNNKIKEDNARKRIQRLPDEIGKIKGVCCNGQSILFVREKWNTEQYYLKILKVLEENAIQHYLIISSLQLHYGVLPTDRLASYSISPVKNIKGHKLFEKVIDDLKRIGLVEITENQCRIRGCDNVFESKSRAISTIQTVVLQQFHDWARKIGLFSFGSAKFNDVFSGYQFGMVAPSYIKSLTGKSLKGERKIIPAFVLADILLKKDIGKEDVDFFVRKIQNILMQNQHAKFIPFLIIGSHDADVYQYLKSNGIVVGNIDELFGSKYSETIYGIFNLISNAVTILKNNPDQYIKLLSEIEKLASGKTFNLKGDLFEMAVGYYHAQLCKNLEISKTITYDGRTNEIDVYAVYQDKVVFAECKGCSSPVSDDYIEKWLTKIIPHIRKWALQDDSLCKKNIVFEIWSTGGFTEKSTNLLLNKQKNIRKFSIDFFNASEMKKLALSKNVPHFKDIIDKYYTS